MTETRCENCKHAGADPDGGFCGHPDSLDATSGYGQGWALARSSDGVCGRDGKLFTRCTCTKKGCPRHGTN